MIEIINTSSENITTARSQGTASPDFLFGETMNNPRSHNGNLRRKHRTRLKAQGLPCALCGQPIHYDEPSDYQHPWSFVIDEKIPISLWKQYGYDSPEAAADDWDNLQPAHYICNALKSNKVGNIKITKRQAEIASNIIDGDW